MTAASAGAVEGSPYVAGYQRSANGAVCYVTASDPGARLYRKQGWRGFQAAVAPWAIGAGIDAESLRLVSRLPEVAGPVLARPTMPRIVAVQTESALACVLTLEVPFELAIFAGHFPTVPIVPGAMLVGWAATLAALHLAWPHGATHSAAIKFRRIVQPGPVFRLHLERFAGEPRLEFRLVSDVALHATGSLKAAAP